jgi:hypothetical protein
MGEKMTSDLIATRRQYRAVYTNWPSELIIAHLIVLDCKVAEMKSDDMIEARRLMDEKMPAWKR